MSEHKKLLQTCAKCVMDTTDPDIIFDANGVCSYCHSYDLFTRNIKNNSQHDALDLMVKNIKRSSRRAAYDCIVGLSGGVDSSYVAHLAKERFGLRVLAVHFDSGWNSELAAQNIENIVKKLDIDLSTQVCNWEEMKDLQVSYFKSGVANCDVPQDHAFGAVLYKIAHEMKVGFILSGHNIASEFVMPISWGHTSHDLTNLKAIHRRFGTVELTSYPQISALKRFIYYPYVAQIKTIRVLNYINYKKDDAKVLLSENYGWRDYGGKHCESKFTKFFQAGYLPNKFGYDKRKPHLASLILSGQTTRELALKALVNPPYASAAEYDSDEAYVAKKLGLKLDLFRDIIRSPGNSYKNYSYDLLFDRLRIIRHGRGLMSKVTRKIMT